MGARKLSYYQNGEEPLKGQFSQKGALLLKHDFSKVYPNDFSCKKNRVYCFPFGMTLPNRHETQGDGYRYGYQGQERDDEIKGNGNSINYKYRMHDPRVGRFFAVDPLTAKYPYNSPYAFSENRVIDGVELEGLEVQVDIKISQQNSFSTVTSGMTRSEATEAVREQMNYEAGFQNMPYEAVYTPAMAAAFVFLPSSIWWGITGYNMGIAIEYGEKSLDARNNGNEELADQYSEISKASWINTGVDMVAPAAARIITNTGKYIKSSSIRFSQRTANGIDEIAESMQKNGWQGDPIDIVKMEDNMYTTVDNTRLTAAQKAGIDVKANVHNYDDAISPEQAARFRNKKTGDLPSTWGEAVENRILNQGKKFSEKYQKGTFNQPKQGQGGSNTSSGSGG